MQIHSTTQSPSPTAQIDRGLDKAKQAFQQLGSDLASGNLSAANKTLIQLQKNAPAQAGNGNNLISEKLATISKAVDAGDLKAAQSAFADLQKTVSQRPTQAGGQGGPPAGGVPPGGGPNATSTRTSNSKKVYDVRDASKDGNVSIQEVVDYAIKQRAKATEASAPAKSKSANGGIDALA